MFLRVFGAGAPLRPCGGWRRPLLTAGFFIASLTARAYAGSATVPDWVRTAAAQTLPDYSPSTKAVVLLDEVTYTVAPDGKSSLHERKAVKILRAQGRSEAEPAVFYGKDSKVVSLHVWSIDPAGHEYALKDNEIQNVGLPGEGGELYSDDRILIAQPPGRDPGVRV